MIIFSVVVYIARASHPLPRNMYRGHTVYILLVQSYRISRYWSQSSLSGRERVQPRWGGSRSQEGK